MNIANVISIFLLIMTLNYIFLRSLNFLKLFINPNNNNYNKIYMHRYITRTNIGATSAWNKCTSCNY